MGGGVVWLGSMLDGCSVIGVVVVVGCVSGMKGLGIVVGGSVVEVGGVVGGGTGKKV